MDGCVKKQSYIQQEDSRSGASYLATFLDDSSKLLTVMPTTYKSQLASVVKEVVQMRKNQTGNKLQCVRTDRGTEHFTAQLEGFFKEKGVNHEKMARYTPEQNGAAERFNRTLTEAKEHVRRGCSHSHLHQEQVTYKLKSTNTVGAMC